MENAELVLGIDMAKPDSDFSAIAVMRKNSDGTLELLKVITPMVTLYEIAAQKRLDLPKR